MRFVVGVFPVPSQLIWIARVIASRSGPTGILPFGFARQAISLTRHLRKLLAKYLRVVPRNVFNRERRIVIEARRILARHRLPLRLSDQEFAEVKVRHGDIELRPFAVAPGPFWRSNFEQAAWDEDHLQRNAAQVIGE